MINIMAGSLRGLFPRPSSRKLEIVSVLTNNACNLRCRHCYLEAPDYAAFLSADEWLRFFTSLFSDIEPSALCFAGKEPFLNGPSVELIQEAVRLRDQLQAGRRTQIGAITNGTLIHRHRAALREAAPDYFDVSIDGLPDVHDHIRGAGAYEQIRPNLRWLIEEFGPSRVWLTHTLTAANAASFPKLVQFYHAEFGVQCFSVGIYQPLPYTDPDLALTREQYAQFSEHALKALANIEVEAPVEVILDLDVKHSALIRHLDMEGWIQAEEPLSSADHHFDNWVVLRLRSATIPVGLWRSVRITPEGYWLASEDLVNVREYTRTAVASLRDADFDARRLYAAGLASPRFLELLQSAPLLQQAYNAP